jgi:hypothetical protein
LAWTRSQRGDQAMEQGFGLIGQALFVDRRGSGLDLVREVAVKLGLPAEDAVAAASEESWDGPILEDHAAAMALVGDQVGSPVIALEDGAAFFGPVLRRAPVGEAAGRVWDGCVLLASEPDFFELKRSRGPGVRAVFS